MEKTTLQWLNGLPYEYKMLALAVRDIKQDDVEYDTAYEAVINFSSWDDTPQGWEFWKYVCNTLFLENIFPPLSELNHLRKDFAPPAPPTPTPTAQSRIPHKPMRPAHYGGEENVYEPIKVIRAWGLEDDFYLANVLKYIARRNAKGDYAGDVAKAAQYMDWKIEQLNGKQK